MNSKILIGNTKNVRFFIIDSTKITKDMMEQNDLPDYFAYDLSKLLSLFEIVRENSKIEDTRVYLRVRANGMFGDLSFKTTGKDKLIARINIDEEKIEKFNEMCNSKNLEEFKKYFSIGDGVLEFTYDYGLKQNYNTNIEIKNGNVDDSIYNYYLKSEQVQSIVSASTYYEDSKLLKTGGLLIQALPNADEEILKKLENKMKKIHDVATLLKNDFTLEKIAELIFEDDDKMYLNGNTKKEYIEEYNISRIKEIKYECDCSLEKMITALKISLSINEIKKILEEDGKIEMVCNLCGKKYVVNSMEELGGF